MPKSPVAKPLARFGVNVRKRREALGLTQEKAGERANLDPTYISGIERGVRNPSLLSMVQLATAFDVTLSVLCQEVEQ